MERTLLYVNKLNRDLEATGITHAVDHYDGTGRPLALCGDSLSGYNWTGNVKVKTTLCPQCKAALELREKERGSN